MRKWLSIALVLVMALALLAACSGDAGISAAATSDSSTSPEGGSEPAISSEDEPYVIDFALTNVGLDYADAELVAEAINEMLVGKINATIRFKQFSIANLANQYNLWISAGEKVDLIPLLNTPATLVDAGQIISISEYLNEENMPNVMSKSEDWPFLMGGTYAGDLYTIPILNPGLGSGGAVYADTALLDGVDFPEKDIYSYEDLDAIFAQMKANHPDVYPYGVVGPRNESLQRWFLQYDLLGDNTGVTGAIKDSINGPLTVESIFASDDYYEYLTWARKWNQAGYISPDAATSSDTAADWLRAGRIGSTLAFSTPGNEGNTEAMIGRDLTMFQTKAGYVETAEFNLGSWAVPITSENPLVALQFLDILYGDTEILNTLMYGIEGTHWVRTDEDMIIAYPEGVDTSNSGYPNTLGLYGDKRIMYMFAPNTPEFYTDSEAYSAKSLENTSRILGYKFDVSSVSADYAAVSNVLSEYLVSLEYGMMDLDTAYPEFLAALESAGINNIIEESQRQVDAFVAQQS